MRIADIVAIFMLVLVIGTIAVIGIGKADTAYHASRGSWYVKSVNYGFAIATNGEGDEVLARNPVPDLQPGDTIIMKGFGFSELPYIQSKVSTSNK